MNNKRFEELKKQHPDWSDEQIWTKISIDMEAEKTIDDKKDIDPNDPDIIKSILEGARRWLRDVLPQIFARIRDIFENIISNINAWIKKGFDYVIELIGKLTRRL